MKNQDVIQFNADAKELICQGEWNLAHIAAVEYALKKMTSKIKTNIVVNGQAITHLDSAGAWLIQRWIKKLAIKKITVTLTHFSEQQQKLFSIINNKSELDKKIPEKKHLNWLDNLGKNTIKQTQELIAFLSFIGKLALEALRVLSHPTHLRWRALVGVIDKTGYQALPIIALLSFMIGVVISYQMGNQLRNYGANVFIVNLLGLSILREFGPLLASIMIAGRTGSAFTAQLGTMKINQEIDALNTMGVTPAELLLLPRLAGLFIALPLLTMWSDIFGILGGMIMANNMLGVSWHEFLRRFAQEIPLRALLIGLGKAPVFALIIASIGCFEGMRVQGSADSVGKQTTRSVVLAIFFIIVVDAIFSVIFSKMKL